MRNTVRIGATGYGRWAFIALTLVVAACRSKQAAPPPGGAEAAAAERASAPAATPGTFGDDLDFLRAHTPVIVLRSADEMAQVAVAPGYEGRVMTSTAGGFDGPSYGFIHRPVIALGTRQPHMTVLGGEDRFWLGPEGGQFALYFPPGAAFDNDHWQVPEPIDWGGWPVTSQSTDQVTFTEPMTLTNYAGTQFVLRVDRTIRLLARNDLPEILGHLPNAGVRVVAFESDNRVTNVGTRPWQKATGLPSIWIIGQMRPTTTTTIVVPFKKGPASALGPPVNAGYFGVPPAERLRIGDGELFFRGDGKSRGKIGVPAPRARDTLGSYDSASHVLTIVRFDLPAHATDYVNSMWEQQKAPYGGDVVNSYNDGPLGPGQPPLGPFYEMETSSPAAALAPNATIALVRRTVHLEGTEAQLDPIARAVLGVSLADITASLPPPAADPGK